MQSLSKPLPVVLVGALCLASVARSETPCDFKGVFVGDRMSPAELMTALGVNNYKTNPQRASFDERLPFVQKYGLIAAGELEDWEIGPYCVDTYCRVPYGVSVPILDQKYGPDWTVERDEMPITDLETKKVTTLERIELTHATNGRNPKTNDTCEIWAANLDIVFQHHDALGPFHSTFVIKLVSKNF